MKTIIAAALLVLTPQLAAAAQKPPVVDAPSGHYVADLTHASIIARVSHMGLSQYPVRFTKFDAMLHFDAAKPEKSSLSVTIDPASLRTEFPEPDKKDFDGELRSGKDWFNATAFPKITFVSKSIIRTGRVTADIVGDLTLLGVTRPITLKATYNGSMKQHMFTGKPMLGFSATGTLKRSAFGLSKFIPVVGDDVMLQIEAEFTSAP